MATLWHPAIHADWLVLQRTGTFALVRAMGIPALLLAGCVAVACGDLYGGYGWCLAASALLALGGSYAITHRRLLDALERWRFGWCGALPVARGATLYTLSFIALAALIASCAAVAALLLVVAAGAPHRADLPYALAGIELALGVGTTVAVMRVFRGGMRTHHEGGVREPLLALPWLNDPHLPYLFDWQRRAALVRWRRGGSFVVTGIVLAAVPMGAPMFEVAGLVLLALSWTWLAVVMRASADATNDALALLGATPLDGRRARRASFRYPVVAALCVLVPMAVGAALGGHGMIVPAWIVCVCGAPGIQPNLPQCASIRGVRWKAKWLRRAKAENETRLAAGFVKAKALDPGSPLPASAMTHRQRGALRKGPGSRIPDPDRGFAVSGDAMEVLRNVD